MSQQPPRGVRGINTLSWVIIAVLAVCIGVPLLGCVFWGSWYGIEQGLG